MCSLFKLWFYVFLSGPFVLPCVASPKTHGFELKKLVFFQVNIVANHLANPLASHLANHLASHLANHLASHLANYIAATYLLSYSRG